MPLDIDDVNDAGTTDNVESATKVQNELGFGQGPGGASDFHIIKTAKQCSGREQTVTFSQTFRQFLGPTTQGAGVSVTTVDGEMCFKYDFGASYLPYKITRAAVRPEHLFKYLPDCKSYEILSHNVKLDNLVCSKDDIQSDGRIVTTWQKDTVEMFIDRDNHFRPANVLHCDRAKDIYDVSYGFRHVEPTSIEEGTLPRACLIMSPEMYNATSSESLHDLKWGRFDPYHGLFSVETWHGGEWNHNHSINSGRIPVGVFDGATKQACNLNEMATANELLDTVWGVQANMANQMNRSPILPAPRKSKSNKHFYNYM